jgi:hypothetical protein
MIFEVVNSLKMYVICCIALVEMILPSLRLWMANLPAGESMGEFASIYNVDNSGILASLLSLDSPTWQLLWISALYQNLKCAQELPMIVVPITIRRFAPCFRLPCTVSHKHNSIVDNFVDNQPNVPCICHTFSEIFQNINCKTRALRVVVT